jgi:hypothetical protein
MGGFFEQGRLIAGQSRSFVKLALDLAIELPNRPSGRDGFRFVDGSRFRLFPP